MAMLRDERQWCARRMGWLLSLGLCLVAIGQVRAGPVVDRISFTPQRDGAGYAVRIHTTERLHAYSEPRFVAGHQLEFVLFNAELSQACQRDAPVGPIQAYTVEMRQGHLVLRFQLDAQFPVKADAYRDRSSEDLILDLTYMGGFAASTAPLSPFTSGSTPRGSPLAPHDARARWQFDTVVIDAGHGGEDSGALGAAGVQEKDINLAVALRVGQYLEQLLGLRVVYTRQDDRFITLSRRGHIANEAGAKLFLSIHSNAARNRSAQGTETYFLGMHKTEAAQHVMERENSVIHYEEDQAAYEGLNERALIEQTLAQSAYMRSSEQLAGLVQKEFTQRIGRIDRGVKQAGFYVLWGASMPAILVELGFVTNREEAVFMASENGQIYLASAIYRAVKAFKEQYEKGVDLGM